MRADNLTDKQKAILSGVLNKCYEYHKSERTKQNKLSLSHYIYVYQFTVVLAKEYMDQNKVEFNSSERYFIEFHSIKQNKYINQLT